MHLTSIGSGEFHVTANPEDVLVVYDLGEAIAIMIFDPVSKVGGLLHFPLPDSSPNPDRARTQPATFADTGIPLFLRTAAEFGAQKEQLVIHAVGGAQLDPSVPQMGKKNYLAMRKILWKSGVFIKHENIGGSVLRIAALQLDTGLVMVRESSDAANDEPNSANSMPVWAMEAERVSMKVS